MQPERRHDIDLFVARCFGFDIEQLSPNTYVVMNRRQGRIIVLATELTINGPEHPERGEWSTWPPSFLKRP